MASEMHGEQLTGEEIGLDEHLDEVSMGVRTEFMSAAGPQLR